MHDVDEPWRQRSSIDLDRQREGRKDTTYSNTTILRQYSLGFESPVSLRVPPNVCTVLRRDNHLVPDLNMVRNLKCCPI